MKPKSLIFDLHRWAGLLFGAILLVIGLTGSAIVFWQELDPQVYPELYRNSGKPTASLERVIAAAQATVPKIRPTGVTRQEENIYMVHFTTPDQLSLDVFVDPLTYTVRGQRIFQQSFFGLLYSLHYQLLAGEAGEWVTGITAIMLMVLSFSGLVLWPGWKKWKAGTSLRWRSNTRILAFDIHKLTGLFALLFLVILGATGTYFTFNEPLRAAIYTITGTPQMPKLASKPIPGRSPLGADVLLAKAKPHVGDAELRGFYWSDKADAVGRVVLSIPGEGAANSLLNIYLDRYSGEVLQVQDARRPNTAELVLNWVGPLHFGTFAGVFSQIMYLFIGLAPGGLFLTGFWLWLKKLR
ncbi:MAG: PepSY domain-containing protein [Anaerolineae bacterium]|nr:PepSY domain-containing protein [Gloeobacterales cyanobacterium ES-bin-313]